jgi:hypothetical protein
LDQTSASDTSPDYTEDPEVTQRLQHLRRCFAGESAKAFAQWIGVPQGRWTHVEKGGPLSKQLAFELRKKIKGLSFDWLYFGEVGNLSVTLCHRLNIMPPAYAPEQFVRLQSLGPSEPTADLERPATVADL